MGVRIAYCVTASVFLLQLALPLENASSQENLRDDAVWELRYDEKLDGRLHDVNENKPRWRVVVVNKQIFGALADGQAYTAIHRITGEISKNGVKSPTVVSFQQVSQKPAGYKSWYSGFYENGKIVGTWFDTRGKKGDFEFVIVPTRQTSKK